MTRNYIRHKPIPEYQPTQRDLAILQLYQTQPTDDKNLAAIGRQFHLTRERVRVIINRFVRRGYSPSSIPAQVGGEP